MKNYKSIERGEEDASYNLCTGIFWEKSIQRDTNVLIGAMEKLVLALKPPEVITADIEE